MTTYKEYAADIRRAGRGLGERVRSFTITTGTPDRQGDTVNPAGWHLDNYRRNPVVLFAHDYKSLPIGKALDVRRTAQGLAGDVDFAPREVYPFADTVLGLIDFGALKATSVGFDPIKWTYNEQRRGTDFHEQELLEFSVVPVPANAEALQMAAKELGPRFAPYRRWLAQTCEQVPRGFGSVEDFLQRTRACDRYGQTRHEEDVMRGYDLRDDQHDLITIDFDLLAAQGRAAARDAAERVRQHTIAVCRQSSRPMNRRPSARGDPSWTGGGAGDEPGEGVRDAAHGDEG